MGLSAQDPELCFGPKNNNNVQPVWALWRDLVEQLIKQQQTRTLFPETYSCWIVFENAYTELINMPDHDILLPVVWSCFVDILVPLCRSIPSHNITTRNIMDWKKISSLLKFTWKQIIIKKIDRNLLTVIMNKLHVLHRISRPSALSF